MIRKILVNEMCFIKIAFLLFCCQIAASLVNPYLSLFLAQDIKVSSEEIGIFVTLSSISAMVVSVLVAKRVDRTKHYKRWIGIAISAAIVGYYLYSIVNSYVATVIISTTLIAIATCLSALIYAYAKALFDQNNVSEQKVASLRIFVSLAWVIGPLFGMIAFKYGDFEGIFKACSFGYLIAMIVLLLLFQKNKCVNYNVNVFENNTNTTNTKRIYVLIYFVIFVTLQMVNAVLNTKIPLYITEILGYENMYVGWLSSFNAIVEIPITILCVVLAQRKNIRKLICFGIFNGIIFILLLTRIESIYYIIVIHFIKAVYVSICMSLGIVFFQSMIPQKYGLSTILFTNTTRVGNIFSGLVISMFGNKYIELFYMLLLVCGVNLVVFKLTNNKIEKENQI